MENMKVALEAVGGDLSSACTVTTYLTNLERDFDGYNKVYREFFHTEPPAELPYRREWRRIWVRYRQSRFSTDQTLFDAPEHA
jgi:hypothetical protein